MITKAKPSNAKELLELENSSFAFEDSPLKLKSFYYHIKNNNLFVFKEDGKIVGYLLWLERKNYMRLYSICVDKNYKNLKIGSKLLEYSFKEFGSKNYSLEVKTTNTSAIKLYEKYGFKIKKTLKDYYDVGVDAYLMIV